MTRLLITGGGGAGVQALWNLWQAQHELYFADADASAFPPNVPQERRVVLPMATRPDFVSVTQAACERLKIDILIPAVDEELLPLAQQRGRPAWPRLLLPEAGFVETMLDKLNSMRAIAAAGLPSPDTAPLSDRDALDRFAFPLILKPRKGRGSRGVMVVQRKEQIAAYLALYELEPDEVVAQALVAGQEYTVFAYADEGGRLLTVVPVKVLHKRGITIRACTDDNPAVVAGVVAFHHAFKPSGPYNFQCIQTPEGHVLPFEVNPRVSTTFCLAIAAGADPLALEARPRTESMPALFRVGEAWSLTRNWTNHMTRHALEPQFDGHAHA